MKDRAWAGAAALVAMAVGGTVVWSVDEQRENPTPVADVVAAAPSSVDYRVPMSSPWEPGTPVMITRTRPVPGETIRVGQCTVAYSFTAGDRSFAVTASHCGTPGDFVWPAAEGDSADFREPVGKFLYSDLYDVQSSRLDVGIIEITDPVYEMMAPALTEPTAVAERVDDLPETICKYGMTTGETCGAPVSRAGVEILADHDGVELQAVAATAQVCARAGDSGGPVYADLEGRRVIVGLVSGTRDAARESGCDDPAAGPMTMSYTSMSAIQTVVDRVIPDADYQIPIGQ